MMMMMIEEGGYEDHSYDNRNEFYLGDNCNEFYLDENLSKHVPPIAITSGTWRFYLL